MSDKIEGWHPFWVGASKDKYGYWKWKSTSEYVDHKLWVESHSRAFNSPDSCANVLPGHYKLGLHGGLCNNTYYYVCEANTAMSEEALLPSEVSPTDSSPTTVITSSAVISVAGIFAIFLLILIILFITRKRLRNSKPNIQPELKDKSAVPNSDSRIPNIIFLGDAPIFPDLVVDHPNGSAIPRLNVKLDDKSDEPRIKELLQCGREICEEDKLSVSDHLGLRWCEVGRRMKFSGE
ncbi:unnamed protein product [Meganyctiphanes norvegica]|uniref:C-type lectin domain-containing protein n=1 Tax=Meganyctiphanes norvegica TaxID=48144 RepID=A0AAV2Q4I4_MEGNR